MSFYSVKDLNITNKKAGYLPKYWGSVVKPCGPDYRKTPNGDESLVHMIKQGSDEEHNEWGLVSQFVCNIPGILRKPVTRRRVDSARSALLNLLATGVHNI